MFLGDVIYKSKRDTDREVTVRAIEYCVDDEEFNEVKYDYRGNPQYSTMISKLCEYSHRSEFILNILSDTLKEDPNQQVMILAHNKNILKYLYDAIVHRNIATAGYYLGGMKEAALKETESKQVVIATYAMAAEALDIKTLTTLIMATPKTDIEQSIGRILREKHSSPVVWDIVDSHQLFRNQWKKRKAFYKKENYKIMYTTNTPYKNREYANWKIIYTPKKCKPTKNNNSSDEEDDEPEETSTNDKYVSEVCFLKNK
jgi:superfamily II DNA or RNA helicase